MLSSVLLNKVEVRTVISTVKIENADFILSLALDPALNDNHFQIHSVSLAKLLIESDPMARPANLWMAELHRVDLLLKLHISVHHLLAILVMMAFLDNNSCLSGLLFATATADNDYDNYQKHDKPNDTANDCTDQTRSTGSYNGRTIVITCWVNISNNWRVVVG